MGLAPEDVFWVLDRVVPSLDARRAGLIEGRHTPTLFALRDLRKDVDLAEALDINAVAIPYREVRSATP